MAHRTRSMPAPARATGQVGGEAHDATVLARRGPTRAMHRAHAHNRAARLQTTYAGTHQPILTTTSINDQSIHTNKQSIPCSFVPDFPPHIVASLTRGRTEATHGGVSHAILRIIWISSRSLKGETRRCLEPNDTSQNGDASHFLFRQAARPRCCSRQRPARRLRQPSRRRQQAHSDQGLARSAHGSSAGAR